MKSDFHNVWLKLTYICSYLLFHIQAVRMHLYFYIKTVNDCQSCWIFCDKKWWSLSISRTIIFYSPPLIKSNCHWKLNRQELYLSLWNPNFFYEDSSSVIFFFTSYYFCEVIYTFFPTFLSFLVTLYDHTVCLTLE